MSFFHGIRKQMKVSAIPFLGVAMLFYFTYHLLHGDRSLLSWWKLQKRIYKAEATAGVLGTQKLRLEKHVKLLNPTGLDPDMLEERARLMLNFGHSDDVIILDQERKK